MDSFILYKRNTNLLDSLDYRIVDDSQFLGIENLEAVCKYLLAKRDNEYNHVDSFDLHYILCQINYITENNFDFNNEQLGRRYIILRKQLINWLKQCNTQDENGNDEVDIIE